MKHSFKNTNTIVIQGWMINDLNLSGNELILYALIYGFSQDGESEFYGSLNYVSTALNCSKPTAIKSLNSLVDKNLIFKTQNSINGIVYSKYSVNVDFFNGSKETLLVKNYELGSKETLRGSKETLPNNNIYNNIYNNTNVDFQKLIQYYNLVFNKSVRILNQKAKQNLKQRIKDGYTKEEIQKVIDNASNDSFHKEQNYKHVTLEFLFRPQIFERYVSMPHQKPIKKGGFTNH